MPGTVTLGVHVVPSMTHMSPLSAVLGTSWQGLGLSSAAWGEGNSLGRCVAIGVKTLREEGWGGGAANSSWGGELGTQTTEAGTPLAEEEAEDMGGDISSKREARGIGGVGGGLVGIDGGICPEP